MDSRWRDAAACRSVDTGVFYPQGEADEGYEPAREVCRTCPVKFECLEFAVATREDEGMWGGLSPLERRRLRRARRAARLAS